MGKMKGDIYKYYMMKYDANDPGNSSPRLPKWECRFCSKQYVQNATKMRHHVLNMCEEVPAPLKLALLDIPNVSVQEDSNEEAKVFLSALGVSTSPPELSSIKSPKKTLLSKQPLKKRKALSTHGHGPSTSHASLQSKSTGNNALNLVTSPNSTFSSLSSLNAEQESPESLWVLLARALYASGCSLAILENPYWVDVFQRISPGISLPSKQIIAKDLLDKELNKIEMEVEKAVADAKYVGIQCEAWYNNRCESMVTFVVTTPTPYSFITYRTGATHHAEAAIAEQAISVVKDIQAKNSVVLSFVTRTAAHMKLSWTKIHSVYPNVLNFGCVVESLGLLLDDMLEYPHIAIVLDITKLVTSKLNCSPILKSKLESIQGQLSNKVYKLKTLKRSSPMSYLMCLQSVLNSQEALKWLAVDEESLQVVGEELSLLVSDKYWTELELLLKLFFPVIKWLSIMKEEKPEISLVAKAYIEIKTVFQVSLEGTLWQEEVLPTLLSMLSVRREPSMQSVHLAASLLDPRQQGSCLDQDQVLQATEFIDNFCDLRGLDSGAVITELSQFRMKTDFYSKPFLWKVTEKVPGSVWWTTMAPKTDLAQLAAAILNIPPATFTMDRSLVHNDSPNISRDCKLVYVAHNLRLCSRSAGPPSSRDSKRLRAKDNNSAEGVPRPNDVKSPLNGIIDWDSLESFCSHQSESESEADEEVSKKECNFETLTPETYSV